jgi:hypothetical protein
LAYAKIIITQGGVAGSAGVARDDIALYAPPGLPDPVYLSNDASGNIGVVSWLWTLRERPEGSTAMLIASTSMVCELQPDVEGTYVVSLSVNGLSRGTTGYAETLVGCRFDEVVISGVPMGFGDFRVPAFLESTLANWGGNWKGAQPEIDKFMREVRAELFSLLTMVGPSTRPDIIGLFRVEGAIRVLAEFGDPAVSCGYFRFDPTRRAYTDYPVNLFAHILASGATVAGSISIYDVGPATGPATPPVLIHEFPIAGPSGPQFHFSLDLLFDAAVPALGTIVLADRQYEIVLEVLGVAAGDIIFLGSAGLEVGGI